MASYFDEHNCQPLAPGQTPDHFLHLARLLLHTGYWQDLQMEFSALSGFGEKPPPPASKEIVENLPTITSHKKGSQCAVCLKEWGSGEEGRELPCAHTFHATCILPWLANTNSCPMCRHELPTDDEDYEEYRRQKKRAKEREADLEALHDSMFS